MRRAFVCVLALVISGSAFATSISLTVGASSLPEGSAESITIVTDAAFRSVLDVASSDPSIIAVPSSVTVSFGSPSLIARFLTPGSATITVTTADGTKATAMLTVTPGAVLTPIAMPPTVVQPAGSGGQTLSLAFVNSGSQAFSGTFSSTYFDVSPPSATIAAGATQTLTLTARSMSAGDYTFNLPLPQKKCCPVAAQTYPVTLVSLVPSGAGASIAPDTENVAISAPPDSSFAPALVTFTNSSSVPVSGTVIADVPWIYPLTDPVVTIPAKGTLDVEFALMREKRPDSFNALGTEVGTLSFVYATAPTSGKTLGTGGSTSVSVSVADTITLPASPASLPALGTGEVALLMPGMGNVLGSVGQFISDLSLLNREAKTLSNLKLYFAPADGAPTYAANIPKLLPGQAVHFADVTQSFGEGPSGGAGHIGTMQLRFSNIEQLVTAASVFNASNPSGTYGTGIPPLRSDRAVASGERMYLTGLRADASAHTNLYLQEAAGRGASVAIRFFDAAGSVVSQRTESLDPWALRFIGFAVPAGAVSADLTHAGGSGTFVGYATPVDNGGDTWVVADWQRYYGVKTSGAWIVPVAGVVHGAAETYFRTDVAIMNSGSTRATGALRFLARDGSISEKSVSIEAGRTFVASDVVSSFFGITTDTAGFLMFVPSSGSTVMTSRTFSTKTGVTGSFGTAVPGLAPAFALVNGSKRQIAAVEDARRTAVLAATPGTFRTNFGLVETSGAQATVRVTLRYVVPGELVSANVAASRDYTLSPNQYLQQSVRDILGAAAPDNDLHNAVLEFAVVSGSGSVIPYVSSIDNGTGDSLLRVD